MAKVDHTNQMRIAIQHKFENNKNHYDIIA